VGGQFIVNFSEYKLVKKHCVACRWLGGWKEVAVVCFRALFHQLSAGDKEKPLTPLASGRLLAMTRIRTRHSRPRRRRQQRTNYTMDLMDASDALI
jgi:hypothetical protein